MKKIKKDKISCGIRIDQDLYAEVERQRLVLVGDMGNTIWLENLMIAGLIAHLDGNALSPAKRITLSTNNLSGVAKETRYFRLPPKVSEISDQNRKRLYPLPLPASWLEFLIALAMEKYLFREIEKGYSNPLVLLDGKSLVLLEVEDRPLGVDRMLADVAAYVRRLEAGENGDI